KDNINDGAMSAYSGGIGFKDEHFYLDLAYVFTKYEEDYYLYGTQNIRVNPVVNELKNHRILLTLGSRF
ncbi:MAG TPA: hypothetical protein VK994_02470, partial [Bacteroidales bacterium]|nr:hypothetical protein [Bacteroidales bacterium]